MKIVYTGPEEQISIIQAAVGSEYDVEWVAPECNAVAEALKFADIFIDASMKVRLTQKMQENATHLKVISCATTGSDHIEKYELSPKIITLKDTPDVIKNLTPAAELTWAHVLAATRKLNAANRHVSSGGWTREDFPAMMLNGRKIGVVGCGRIGGWVLKYAQAFGMKCVGYDPYIKNIENVEMVSLDELFETSDIITVHVHLNEETEGLISKELFQKIKKGAIFVNTSRGGLCDEAALLAGLRSGRISAAGVDVLDGEPEVENHPLRLYAMENDNLMISPHCGGFSPDALATVIKSAAQMAVKALKQ